MIQPTAATRSRPNCTAPRGRVNVQRALRAARAERNQQRLARRLALQLALQYSIRPYESALVPWLTDEGARCTNNHEALVRWVLRELSQPTVLTTPADAADLFALLSTRLGRRLVDLAETPTC